MFDNENDVHSVTAFSKTLRAFELKEHTISERLQNIIGVSVKMFINPSKGEDDPILNKLEILD